MAMSYHEANQNAQALLREAETKMPYFHRTAFLHKFLQDPSRSGTRHAHPQSVIMTYNDLRTDRAFVRAMHHPLKLLQPFADVGGRDPWTRDPPRRSLRDPQSIVGKVNPLGVGAHYTN